MYAASRLTLSRTTQLIAHPLRAYAVLAGLILIVGSMAAKAEAAAIYAGSRSTSTPGALVSNQGWTAAQGGFKVNFSVTQLANGFWTYDYWFKNASDSKSVDPGICGFLEIEVSKVKDALFNLLSDGSTPGYSAGQLIPLTAATFNHHLWDAPQSDPTYGMYAVYVGKDKNTSGELQDDHITIVSSQAPKWGSFYARAGDNTTQVLNRGAYGGAFPDPQGNMLSSVGSPPAFDPNQDVNGSNVKKWILVPDTAKVVPEPGSILLASQAVLAGVFVVRRLRSKNRKEGSKNRKEETRQ